MDYANSDPATGTAPRAAPPVRFPPPRATTDRGRQPGPASSDRPRRIEAILCDIGDVLIRFNPEVTAGIEQRHGLPAGALPRVMLTSPTARLASVGRIGHGDWLRLVRTALPPPAVDEWLGYHGKLVQPVADLLAAAKCAGVRLLLLSNASRKRWDDLAHHRIGNLADHVFLSAHTGLAKPDPLAYEYVADTCALRLSRTLYVDAEPLSVATGRDLGMPSHLYTDAIHLRAELIAAGVTI